MHSRSVEATVMSHLHARPGKTVLAPMLALAALSIHPRSWCGEIVLNVEEPKPGGIMTGISNIRGWAVGTAGIDRIELYVDGEYKTDIPYGGSRKDVGANYSSYPDADHSGFSMANNYSLKNAGAHLMTIKAYDNDGALREWEIRYNVTRFDSSFIQDPADISILGVSDLIVNGARSLTLTGVDVQGNRQDLRLDWQTQKQNFSITSILPSGPDGAAALEGEYTLSRLSFWFGLTPDAPAGLILDTETESTTLDGVSFQLKASGTMAIDGSEIRTRLKVTITGDGMNETIDESWTDTLVADKGYALTYRDDVGFTWDALLLQRGTQLVWMEHDYGDPEVGDAVVTTHWHKAVEIGTEGTPSPQGVDRAPPATSSPTNWHLISQKIRSALRGANR